MNKTRHRLIALTLRPSLLLGAVAALLFTAISFAQSASAPAGTTAGETIPTPASENELSEVIVTGTRIRGVAAVGSNLITVDQEVMQETGLNTVNDILDTVPAITNLGTGANATVNSPNIHGIGVQATLNLINGHRGWEEQLVSNEFNPNNFPPRMIERIEVVPDGTSASIGPL